ncbi:hypothetical protein GCM10022251_79850 [Phytohabitans flavus]|uniref:Uncharacterized protein n=1 Tax=Phytohabitans flavus TaxID=1076124 RepID=A0A6F8Y433_9ACTN|nr:hypothetical protein [Phytohabitans flavus]BCB80884.1 hypothetical protein Pflav_072940 [Phytohabitans flavus]
MVDVTDRADDGEEREQLVESLEDELSGVYGQITDLAFEVDGYLADYRYDEVKQAIESLSGLIAGGEVDDLSKLASLCADAADAVRASAEIPPAVGVEIPRLTPDDLPAIPKPAEDDYDEFIDLLRDRESRCADHIRKLFGSVEQLWDEAGEAARSGQVKRAEDAVRQLRQVPAELDSAYSLWERCLVDLYNEDPGRLGSMGEMVSGFESWLVGRQHSE